MDNALRELYQEVILDHSRHPRHYGAMDGASHKAEGYNPLCGDRVTVYLQLGADGRVVDIKFEGKGCAISQASASMLTDEIRGMSVADVAKLQNQDVLDLLGIEISPARLKCALLSIDTLKKAITQGRDPGAAAVPAPAAAPGSGESNA